MSTSSFTLPSLTGLLVFEAAGRLSSFRLAADELNVSPSAISHQIRGLEAEMHVSLFKRENRAVTLTMEGEALLAVLQDSFAQVSLVIEQLRHGHEKRSVTICATTAMSSLWLTPRLSQFWKAHGDIAVNQHVSDLYPVRNRNMDLQIWYGQCSRHDKNSHLLFEDRLLPVCSAESAPALRDLSLAQLAMQPLIHLDTETDWTTWQTWFQGLGYTGVLQNGMRVNNYTIAVQAAIDGVGVLLGWERLLKPVIDSGQLIALTEHVLKAPGSFYLTCYPNNNLRDPVSVLQAWLLDSV